MENPMQLFVNHNLPGCSGCRICEKMCALQHEKKYNEARQAGYELISYVCSRACNIGDVPVGDNTLVLENTVIQPLTRIGSNVFLWSGNHVGHHAEIRDHVYVCGHVILSGNAVIGENCFLGVNSTLGHNVTLGHHSIVGAGARILKSAEPRSVLIEPSTSVYRLDSEQFMRFASLE